MSRHDVDEAADRQLTAGLRALAHSSNGVANADAMEASLLEAFDAHHARVRRSAWRSWAAAAAMLILVAGLVAVTRTVSDRPAAETPQAIDSGFVPWPGATALPAFESGQLVRTELPASVLPLLGIAQADAPAGGHVIADVLYGQDGLARAVRLVKQQSMQP